MKSSVLVCLCGSLFFFLHPLFLTAQKSGTLDSTFGVNGIRTVNVKTDPLNYAVSDYVQFTDGSIITAGLNSRLGRFEDLVLIKYKKNGTVDSSFWTDGIQYFGKAFTQPLKRLGKLFLSEQTDDLYLLYIDNNNAPGILNLNPDGSVDSSFGYNGFLAINDLLLPAFSNYTLLTDRTVRQANGWLVFSGHGQLKNNTGSSVIFSFRLKPNGTVDVAFGTGGISTPVIDKNWMVLKDVHAFRQDSLVYTIRDYEDSIFICKTDVNGTLNNTFGNKGRLQTTIYDEFDLLNFISLPQPDGSLMVSRIYRGDLFTTHYLPNGQKNNAFGNGSFDYWYFYDDFFDFTLTNYERLPSGDFLMLWGENVHRDSVRYFIGKLKPDGTMDKSFGNNGLATYVQNGVESPVQLKTAEGTSNYFTTLNTSTINIELARYSYTGSQLVADKSFGSNGRISYRFPHSRDYPFGMGKLKDGRFIVAGKTTDSYDTTIYLFRYAANGKKDPAFGVKGTVSFKIPTDYTIYSRDGILATSDDHILLPFIKNSGEAILLYCLDKEGALVKNYGNNGIATFEWNSNLRLTSVRQLLKQPDKKIVVLATCSDFGYTAGFLCRLMPDGKRDSLFGNKGLVAASSFSTDEPSSIFYTKTNKIVVNIGAQNHGGRLVCYNYWGDLDTTFITYGQPVNNNFNYPYQEAIDVYEQDSVYVSFQNEYLNYYDTDYQLFMYSTPVQKEQFWLGKRIEIPFPEWMAAPQNHRMATKVYRQNNGKYIIAMTSSYYKEGDYYNIITLARVDAQGILDSSFGTNGYFNFDGLEIPSPSGMATYTLLTQTSDNNLLVSTMARDEQLEDITLFKVILNDGLRVEAVYPPVPRHPSQVITAIPAITPSAAFMLYPNPATDKLFFRLPNNMIGRQAQVQIFNAEGDLVQTVALIGKPNNTIHLQQKTKGFYAIWITIGNKSFTRSFIIN